MKLVVRNCNCIDSAEIVIEPGKLNIKYGPNGTGKSTLAQAIHLSITNGDLSSLVPFKRQDKQGDEQYRPSVHGTEALASIATFNENYISQFVFKPDEVVQNSFEIFVKTPDYEKKMDEIEKLIADIKETFKKNQKLDDVARDLADLSDSFGKSKSGFSKSGRIAKAIGGGNKIENIPPGLEGYADFLRSEHNVKWIRWQIEGNSYSEISSDCPYCTMSTDDKKETIRSVSKEYDAKSIEHLNALRGIVDRLGRYFSREAFANLNAIIKNKTELKKEEENYLVGVKSEVDVLREKLSDLRSLSFFSLKDVDKVVERIEALKISLDLLPALNSPDTAEFVNALNKALESVAAKAGLLEGEINKLKQGIEKTITRHSQEINDFLKYAGYKYSVHIENDNDSYKMRLRHLDSPQNIQDAASHLSYGEKNAFSLVMFMYECLSKGTELIVLDDPISSFDRSKKFAIVEKLFRGAESLQGKTVLMLTHDIEPLIDVVKSLSHTFNPRPTAAFLQLCSGTLTEIAVTKDDVLSFTQVCQANLLNRADDFLRLIHLRRYYEIVNDKGMEYQLVSNLFKGRATPIVKLADQERGMTDAEIVGATKKIEAMMPSFNYSTLLARATDSAKMVTIYQSTSNNYEWLQLFRIINTENHANDVIKKFVNETFHIENEYVMQLNPCKYDFVPEYIVAECDQVVLGA